MYGMNKTERKRVQDEGQSLDIIEIYSTLQGEGPHAGLPATFVRLAGCHLKCYFCDTDFNTGRRDAPLQTLLDQIEMLGNKLVVITGGEPLRQNIVPLAASLNASGHYVQVETAGHFWWEGLEFVADIVVSPKTPLVHGKVTEHAIAWKYIVVNQFGVSPEDGLPIVSTQSADNGGVRQRIARPPAIQMQYKHNIYIQPCDREHPILNAESLAAAMAICFRHGYRLSLQQHKILKLR